MMDAQIASAVSAGTISAADQNALSSALDSIDSSLSSDQASGQKPTGGMKGRIDGLIDQQVKDGKLTDDQAKELKSFFAQGPHGQHRPDGTGGTVSSSTDSAQTSFVDTTNGQSDNTLDALIGFLQQLRSSQNGTTYNLSNSGSASSNSGLVLDTKI
jgi:hypothetical protein